MSTQPTKNNALFIALILSLVFFSLAPVSAKVSTPAKADMLQKIMKLNVPFIVNEGQVDQNVTFYARTFSGAVFVTKEGNIIYSLPMVRDKAKVEDKEVIKGVALKEELIGGRIKSIRGEDESPTKASYLRGKDQSKWRSCIATYNVVNFGEVYPGIELKLKAYGKNVEKLFYIKPGVEPAGIKLRLSGGAKTLTLNSAGELEVVTKLGVAKFTKPVAYQEINGKRVEVPVCYTLLNSKLFYGFKVGDYDRERELVIDPLLASTYLGGSSDDLGFQRSIAIDSSGNVYMAGWTYSSDFPTTDDAYDKTYNGGDKDAFITIFNANLTTLLASTFLGGSGDEDSQFIAIDSSGNVYVAGRTSSLDFPTTDGVYDKTYNGGEDIYISKLSTDLTTLLASTFLGGSDYEVTDSILSDSSGNVYVAGRTYSEDFPTTDGAYDRIFNGLCDVFISKMNTGLTTLLASTFLGGNDYDEAKSIALDSLGNLYVVGYTYSSNFPTTEGAYDRTYNGGYYDAYISKFNPGLTTLLASTFLDGNDYDYAESIAINSLGNIYVAGLTASSDFPTTEGAYDRTFNGYYDAYISKFSTDLTTLLASTFFGGSGDDKAWSVSLNSLGNVYVAGETASSNFPTTEGAYDRTFNGYYDAYISKFSTDLTTLLASTFLGGSMDETAYSIIIDSSGDVFIAGRTASSDFPTTEGAYDRTYNGYYDAYLAKLDSNLAVGPTLATLTQFDALPGDHTVTIVWTTASEVDNEGFNIYRKAVDDSEYSKINSNLIPAQGNPLQGSDYTFIDDRVENRTAYEYLLGDVDIYGHATQHGPIFVIPHKDYSKSRK